MTVLVPIVHVSKCKSFPCRKITLQHQQNSVLQLLHLKCAQPAFGSIRVPHLTFGHILLVWEICFRVPETFSRSFRRVSQVALRRSLFLVFSISWRCSQVAPILSRQKKQCIFLQNTHFHSGLLSRKMISEFTFTRMIVLDLPPGAWIWPCPQAHHLKFGYCEIVFEDSLLTYLTCKLVRSSQRHHVEEFGQLTVESILLRP